MSKPKSKSLKTWSVEYERTCRGTAFVEAETEQEARDIVDSGGFDYDPVEEMTDWEVRGGARPAIEDVK